MYNNFLRVTGRATGVVSCSSKIVVFHALPKNDWSFPRENVIQLRVRSEQWTLNFARAINQHAAGDGRVAGRDRFGQDRYCSQEREPGATETEVARLPSGQPGLPLLYSSRWTGARLNGGLVKRLSSGQDEV